MSTAELPEKATSEQIAEVVEQQIERVQGEDETGTETGKTETSVGSDNDEYDINADETLSDDEQSAGEGSAAEGGEETEGDEGTEGEESSWIDDDVRGLASAYQVSDEQLSQFTSRDELERALTLLDSHVAQAGGQDDQAGLQQQGQEQQQQQQVERHPNYPDRRPDGTLLPADQRQDSGEFQVELSREEFDDAIVDQFDRLHQHYGQQMAALNAQVQSLVQVEESRAWANHVKQFDDTIDALDATDLFGKTGEESKEQMANRQKLMNEFGVRREVHHRAGRQLGLNKPVLERLCRSTFAEHFFKQQRKALTQKVSRQAGLKMGTSVTRPNDPKSTLRQEMREKYAELEREG